MDEDLKQALLQLSIQSAKTDAQLAKTDAQLAKTDAQLAETAAQIKETDIQLAKTEAAVEKLSNEIRNHIGNDSQSDEEYFYQTLAKNMRLGNIQYDEIGRNIRLNANSPEFDIVLYNGNTIGLIEVKKKAHVDEVRSMAESKIKAFKRMLPHYANHQFYFGVATMVSYADLISLAKEQGIYLLTQQGNQLAYLNDEVRVF